MDIKDVAKEIRTILKSNFSDIKFSVKCSRFSQGSAVNVSWTDGPTTVQVDELIARYGNSRSRFIGTNRTHSRELVTQAIAAWKKQNPEYAHITVTCEGETSCYALFNMTEFRRGVHCLEDCEHSLNKIIYGSAFDGINLVLPQNDTDNCEPETVSVPKLELVEAVTEATPHLHPQSEQQSQSNQLDQTELDLLEADRQQAYAQYLASQQEGDELEAKLAAKKTEAQVYFAMMKEIEEKIEAKKREAEVITPQAQPDFDVRTLESKKVTLILINTMGFPVSRHVTVIAADIVSAKRYHGEMTDKKCLELQYIEKGKRKPKGTRYTEASLAVALGWQDIKVPTNNGYIDAFDNGLLDSMVRQAKNVVYTQQGL